VTTAPERHLELPNLFNLRDLGGYPAADGQTVRWRVLFRADGLQRIAAEDVHGLADLGIKTVVDLRRPDEVELKRLEAEDLAYHHHSVQPADWDVTAYDDEIGSARFLADRYLEMTRLRGDAVASVLRLIAAPDNAPLAFHCAAGKDRTGVIAALTLSLLGVDDDDIAADYALSSAATDRWVEWARVHRPEVVDAVLKLPGPWLVAPAEAITMFLADLRAEHGSVEAYVASIGIDDAMIAELRRHLLEPAGVS
jgi:protein-tyrosine phosphatase